MNEKHTKKTRPSKQGTGLTRGTTLDSIDRSSIALSNVQSYAFFLTVDYRPGLLTVQPGFSERIFGYTLSTGSQQNTGSLWNSL